MKEQTKDRIAYVVIFILALVCSYLTYLWREKLTEVVTGVLI